MATPSSGEICWSDIQAATGGGYCMSDFNSATGRGYCASDYYNYSPSYGVYINVIVPSSLTCYNYGYFCAQTYDVNSNYVYVDTTIQVQIYWYGDLSGYIYATVNINTGNHCGSGYQYTGGSINCWGENYSYDSTSVYPTSYGSQNYYINAVNTDAYASCPC
jgi:hypothetical protein